MLGQVFPAGGGEEEVLRLVELLGTHPSTARHVSSKRVRASWQTSLHLAASRPARAPSSLRAGTSRRCSARSFATLRSGPRGARGQAQDPRRAPDHDRASARCGSRRESRPRAWPRRARRARLRLSRYRQVIRRRSPSGRAAEACWRGWYFAVAIASGKYRGEVRPRIIGADFEHRGPAALASERAPARRSSEPADARGRARQDRRGAGSREAS